MLTTRDLEAHERLLINRRKAEMTQVQAAEFWDVTPWVYRQWESGADTNNIPTPGIGRITPVEACVVMRTRLGYSRKRLASLLGISPWWLTQMERGRIAATRLVNFWFPA